MSYRSIQHNNFLKSTHQKRQKEEFFRKKKTKTKTKPDKMSGVSLMDSFLMITTKIALIFLNCINKTFLPFQTLNVKQIQRLVLVIVRTPNL